MHIYDRDLGKNAANFVQLSPVTFLERASSVHPNQPAVVYGDRVYTWAQTGTRCRRLASALRARRVQENDTVAALLANTPEMYEAHFGVPMAGAVLNAINYRLDAPAIAFILQHGEAKVFLVDPEFSEVARDALALLEGERPLVVDVADASFQGGVPIGDLSYDALLEEGDPHAPVQGPSDEWNAISLSYTSGTTGNPKGVVTHHRGAHLNALAHLASWQMGAHPVYLWTLPMFHCNGWCFPWTLAAAAGTSVCLRHVRAEPIFEAIRAHRVTHLCGAPVVLSLLAGAPEALMHGISHRVEIMTGGAAPPAAVIAGIRRKGFQFTHVYGLTEVYGPATLCERQPAWESLDEGERAELEARQGVRNLVLEELLVADPETLEPVAKDGATLGEVFMRGHNVMKGYLKNPSATEACFRGGYFHTGDLAVWHPDGYIEVKDRSKDIIISGGENISSIEIEGVLFKHPDIVDAAVVAAPHAKWGETPCAFVTLREGSRLDAAAVIGHCREHMAHFKVPTKVLFGPIDKTPTGKVQKFKLRERAAEEV